MNHLAAKHNHGEDHAALFEQCFKTNFASLHAYAFSLVKDEQAAEDIVQQIFYNVWKKKESIVIQATITGYMYKAVYNECMNYLNSKKMKATHLSHFSKAQGSQLHEDNTSTKELQLKIDETISNLPQKCQIIFYLSRQEGLTYGEIARRLDISVKTVESQMGKALGILKKKLAEWIN